MDDYNRGLDILFGHPWPLMLFVSALVSWSIGLGIPALIRWLFLKRPLGRIQAFLLTAGLWFFNIIFFVMLLGTKGSSLLWIAFLTYKILRAQDKPKQETSLDEVGHGRTAWDVLRQQRVGRV